MTKFAIPLIVLVLAACGGQEGSTGSGIPSEGAETPAVDAAAVGPAVQECLDLVNEERFNDAIPACLKAVQQDPESAEAMAALQQAQQQAAGAQALKAASEGEVEQTKEGLLEGVRD